MAEAVSPQRRFFCHQCGCDVCPNLPDYTCPRCESGFIEELLAEPSVQTSAPRSHDENPLTRIEEVLDQMLLEFNPLTGLRLMTFGSPSSSSTSSSASRQHASGTDDAHGSSAPVSSSSSSDEGGVASEVDGAAIHAPGHQHAGAGLGAGQQQQRAQWEHFHIHTHAGRVPSIEGVIQQLLGNLLGHPITGQPGASWGFLHSDPGDYAWGLNGLDRIITQLLEQLDTSGPPPADRARIHTLPNITITQQHVDAGLECSVCREDFAETEVVRQLPCKHMYHNDCIVPWLELHDTCPVCRKSLNGENTATNQHAFAGATFGAPGPPGGPGTSRHEQ
ncbi:E3 ubiquitin-protein ligase RNF126-A-like isoform X1 [Lethenteron reissneri]|uniref:E3 ubiquitin-protein ligase RNF126-A-like isoform X1 n=1 Tax=Lethenteron reissneri TaxID=7753 RepID=UPI002AB6B419|nr:E3 ubiquitin-protein ligase RNF126-A-like isoform X1 [Lethenteron reissneri]XP_061426677.1 E3 ubiquitin-protein ligase RNF126-A-like isoform X1 [Lethenteron reissneri]